MKRKLISAVALILCATMLLFCGCKSKKNNDDSTSPSESGAAVDAITDESTEPSTEGTTEPEKKESTPDAIKKVTDSTKKPGKVNTRRQKRRVEKSGQIHLRQKPRGRRILY